MYSRHQNKLPVLYYVNGIGILYYNRCDATVKRYSNFYMHTIATCIYANITEIIRQQSHRCIICITHMEVELILVPTVY